MNEYLASAVDAYDVKVIENLTDELVKYNDELQANTYYIEVDQSDLSDFFF